MAEWKKVLVSGSAAEVTSLKASSVVNAGGDTDKFLVLDSSGNVDFRTGTEVRSDIGAGAGSGDISRVNITAGTGLSGTTDTTSGDHTQTINLGVAAASTLGGIKVGTNLSINGSGVLSSTDTNTTYSVGDGGLTTNDFTNADHSKLNAIEASATADQSAAELRSAIGTGNGNLVPSAGGSGTFLKGDGTFGTPSYVANTDVDVSIANLKTRLGGGFAGNAVTIGDSSDVVTIGKDLVVTGNLTINGTQTTVNTANLAVEDQFIELNDGGSARDAGIVVNLATNGSVATAFGYDQSEGRWAFDLTGATADQTAIASDAYAVTVHKTDSRALAGAISGYAKDGNVLINSDGEIYMYVA